MVILDSGLPSSKIAARRGSMASAPRVGALPRREPRRGAGRSNSRDGAWRDTKRSSSAYPAGTPAR
ncbi:Uncharacterised protein [Mycobacteroides abscessus subsp. abscessus]|nr:Uncharacterised protein [Mycobacteroides abscessus subsp. abscessus]